MFANEIETIDSFHGAYRFLSNFYPAEITYEGIVYATSEHAYQAQKTFDRVERAMIAACTSPGRAKRLSRRLTVRPDWDLVKVEIMTAIVRTKFRSHPDLAEKLLATQDTELVEANTWNDQFWGVCNGAGLNWLGRILMQVRKELRAAKAEERPSLPAPACDELALEPGLRRRCGQRKRFRSQREDAKQKRFAGYSGSV